jgi:hypothetical protein
MKTIPGFVASRFLSNIEISTQKEHFDGGRMMMSALY